MPKFLHECPAWDFMGISEDDPEVTGCSCFRDAEFLEARDRQSKLLDEFNESKP